MESHRRANGFGSISFVLAQPILSFYQQTGQCLITRALFNTKLTSIQMSDYVQHIELLKAKNEEEERSRRAHNAQCSIRYQNLRLLARRRTYTLIRTHLRKERRHSLSTRGIFSSLVFIVKLFGFKWHFYHHTNKAIWWQAFDTFEQHFNFVYVCSSKIEIFGWFEEHFIHIWLINV